MMNGNGQQQPAAPTTAFDGRTEVAVTLNVNTWNVVLSVISKAPWEVADPLIQEIRRQIATSLEPQAGAAPLARPAA
jgi:hypothetical protein